MRKQDLKVGEEYAIGGQATYNRWRQDRGILESLDGTAPTRHGAVKRGIVVRFPDGGRFYPFSGVNAGEMRVLDSARQVTQAWPGYVQARPISTLDRRRRAPRWIGKWRSAKRRASG